MRARHGRDPARDRRSRHHRDGARRPAQPRAPRSRRLGCRNRRRRRHHHADPRRLPARCRGLRASRQPDATRSAWRSCPPTSTERGEIKSGLAELAAEEELRVLGWRDVPVDPERPRQPRPRRDAGVRAGLRAVVAAVEGDKPVGGIDPRAPGLPAAQARRARARRLLPVAVVPHTRLQGHGHDAAARAVLPRSLRRALHLQARARALALLHEHVPVLAARPAVPHDRAQRRDQHGAGQPQLDACPPVAAEVRGCSATSRPSCPSTRRARATRRRSTRSSNCSTSPDVRCRTR